MALADDADAMAAMVAANDSRWCGHHCVASGYLVFKPTSGLGNSLIAAASVAALAAASCREFALVSAAARPRAHARGTLRIRRSHAVHAGLGAE